MTADETGTDLEKNGDENVPEPSDVEVKITPVQIIVILCCVVSLIAVLISGFVYFNYSKFKSSYDSDRNELEQEQLAGIRKSIDDLRSADRQINDKLDQLSAEQESLIAGLAATRHEAAQDNLDWLLREVEYLLIISSQRLALDQNVDVALAALQSAEARLKDFNDPRLLQIRRQFTADINALQAVNRVDISSLALYLLDIADRVESLPLQPTAEVREEKPDVAAGSGDAAEKPFWDRLGDEVMGTLKGFVTIYHDGEGKVHRLMPEQRYHLYQGLQLQLETATRAVLQKDTQNFHSALVLVQARLQEDFDTNDTSVRNIIDALARMSGIELQPVLPAIDSSLETLRAFIRELSDVTPDKGGNPEIQAP